MIDMKGQTDMRKRLIEKLTSKKKGTLGYTLTEMLVVVGIIAIVCAIAIPSIISISRALRFAQANNYAKSIFLAAQQNLTELRSDGSLAPLQGNVSAIQIPEDHCGFPDEDWSNEYVYTASDMLVDAGNGQRSAYDMVLPINSVENTVRSAHVIIEYNPITGNVYSVFYCEDDLVKGTGKSLLELYQSGSSELSRDENVRRKQFVGYYDGSGLSSSDLELERGQAEVEFTNGEEGIVTVKIPVPDHYDAKLDDFIQGLSVQLTITGDNFGGTKVVTIKESNADVAASWDNVALDDTRKYVLVTYVLDSLLDGGSFANVSVREETDDAEDTVFLTELTDDDFITGAQVNKILPGDNVTIQADVTFVNAEGDPAVTIRPGILAGINPMFDYLLTSPTDPSKFTLAVANGRNLQNLNAIHPKVADLIQSVVFTSDINWNTTVNYYNEEHGIGGAYSNNVAEAPGRALPYFVPIQNENLFGTAEFIYSDGGSSSSGYQGVFEKLLEWLLGSDFKRSNKVPTLTDEMDTRVVDGSQIGDTHAKIDGQGHKVYFLNIDATRYQPCASTFYALGEHQIVNYYFAGLFGYVNTTINNLHVVNPIIKGHNFVNQDDAGNTVYMDPATGALVGAAGYNVLITNCSTYLDTTVEGFNWTYGIGTAQKVYDADNPMAWYGVSGEGAVGGLVGYAKSHRTVVGELKNNDTRYLAFSNCFAAVPVSGNMRGNTNKDYGYSNGVGGFIGNSQLTNFYNCYSSGKVMAGGTYYINYWSDSIATQLGLGGNGRLGHGAGGFVGTSHGTRYTNCFSTSNVINNNRNASTGGFVGMMCYDATKLYGHHSDNLSAAQVAQHTVFDSCYATGMCTNAAGAFLEGFSGANGKIAVNYGTLKTFYTGDYYKLLAPYALTHNYATPPYSELYIFKDSYYLSQYAGVQDSSTKCAKPITYDELMGLQERYDDETDGGWIRQQIEAIKLEPLDADDIEPVVQEVLKQIFTDVDIGDIIAGIFGQETESVKRVKEILKTLQDERNYKIYFLLDSYRGKRLEGIYFNKYNESFPSPPWENATDATTHYYGEVDAGKVYPFPKLNTMDYYGLWPEKSLDAGLAYFEIYENEDGTTTRGHYFDRPDTSTLRNYESAKVVSDGYCVFTSNLTDRITVSVDGTVVETNLAPDSHIPITMSSVTSPDDNSYYVVTLPKSVLDAAANAEAGYYHKMVITISGGTTKTVTAYFNPNVAISQVNSNTKPENLPTSISVRSARQLAALTREGNEYMWGEGYNYIQWLNIDVEDYNALSYDYRVDKDRVLDEIEAGGSIGSAEHPFLGTYNGAGYAEVADIVNFKPGTTGLFGFIGEGGEVKNLDVIYNKEDALALGSENVDHVALVAGVNQGTISNVNLTIGQEVSLTAKTNAGLLVGLLSDGNAQNDVQGGVLADCTLAVNENVTVTAPNAGQVIGSTVHAVISDVTVAQDSDCILTVNADYAGGFAGLLVNSDADNVNLTLNAVNAQANALGGFAGYAKGTGENTVSAITVKLDGELKNTKPVDENVAAVYAAGFVGESDTMKYVNVTVNADKNIVGSSAAGMFGSVNQGSIQNAKANIQGAVNGTVEAAGFAVELVRGDYTVKQADVNLTGADAKILSDGRAAGFAVVVGCNVETSTVKLGAYGVSNAPAETAAIQGADEAAGYACSITGNVSASYVRGSANITAANGTAAGFAVEISNRVVNSGVTPAMGDASRNYRYNSNDNMKISGASAAGFVAKTTDVNASVVNSYALGTISQLQAAAADETTEGTESGGETGTPATAIAGFVLQNNGTVDGCTSNVNIIGGYAFAGTNNSLIQNCYSWYSDEDDSVYTEFQVLGEGKILSSYFVDLDLPEEEIANAADGESTTVHGNTVVLYDNEGTASAMLPSDLAGTLELLNSGTNIEWYSPAAYVAKPYIDIVPATYDYPMLRQHFGNWVTRPQYAYGLMYYEKHQTADGSIQWQYNIVDLTNPEITVEEKSLSISSGFDYAAVDRTSVILEAGYALFCKTGADVDALFVGVPKDRFADQPIQDETFQQVINAFAANVTGGRTERYSFYEIKEKGDMIFDQADESGEVRVVTWYANAIRDVNDTSSFLIRTPEQFGYVGQMPAASFSQTHAIQMPESSAFTTIADFTGTYEGNGLAVTVPTGNTWITNLNGTVQNVNLTVSGETSAPIFGAVNGTLELDAVSLAAVSQEGALIDTANGTITTGTITAGQIGSDGNVSLVGSVSGGSVTAASIETGDVNGRIFGDVAAAVTVTGSIETGVLNGDLFGVISANVTTGDIVMASASTGRVFNSVSGGAVTLGNITVSEGDVSQLFGAISGGTVSGTEVKLNGNITSNLFASVTGGATLQNFAVQTPGSLAASLIGNVAGVQPMDSNAAVNTTISNVDVTAVGEASAFTGSGLLVNTLGSYTSLSGCDVETGLVTVKNSASHSVGETVTYPFGGITGVVPANATLTNNTVDADMNVCGEAGKLTVVGGMTAINSGTISGGKVESVIGYTQASVTSEAPDYDSVGIGGLVGWMLPGAEIADAEAEGSINLWAESETVVDGDDDVSEAAETTAPTEVTEPTETTAPTEPSTEAPEVVIVAGDASGRAYYIGGAIAYDGGAVYTDVTTAMVVSEAWAGCNLVQTVTETITQSIINPSGLGCVGKFVGYVENGEFTNCAATDAATTYQFLGEIKVVEATIAAQAGEPPLYTSKSNENKTDIDDLEADPGTADLKGEGYDYTYQGAEYIWYDYPAALTGCTFGWTDAEGNEQTYTQSFDLTYIYGGTNVKRDLYKAVNVGMFSYTKKDGLKYSNFAYSAYSDTNQRNIDTGYYFRDESGQYYKVFLDYVRERRGGILNGKNYHTYTFKYMDDSGEYQEIHKIVDNTDPQNTAYAGPSLWNKILLSSFTAEEGKMYMIVTLENTYALGLDGEAIPFESEFDLADSSNTDLKKAIWTITKNGNKIRWQNAYNTEQYLRLERVLQNWNVRTIFNDNSGADINVKHRGYDNDIACFNVGGPNWCWLIYNASFGLNQTDRYNGDEYRFFIYRIDRNGEVWGVTFGLRPEISELCAVRDTAGNLVNLNGTAAISETEEEPAEETEPATEPTEPIEPTSGEV